jgi:hypothetical protein
MTTTTREYPATQFTFINIFRKDDGSLDTAELWSGISDLDDGKFLLDIYNPESLMDGDYGYTEAYTIFAGTPDEIVVPAQTHPEVLISSWITDPPSTPTRRVRDHFLWEQHVEHEVDMIREGLM